MVCGLTTNLGPTPYSIIVDISDVEQSGTLRHKSKIKADTLASLDQTILIKQIARLKSSIFDQVITEIHNLFRSVR